MCIAEFKYMPLRTERNNQLMRSAIHILLLRSKESPLLNPLRCKAGALGHWGIGALDNQVPTVYPRITGL